LYTYAGVGIIFHAYKAGNSLFSFLAKFECQRMKMHTVHAAKIDIFQYLVPAASHQIAKKKLF